MNFISSPFPQPATGDRRSSGCCLALEQSAQQENEGGRRGGQGGQRLPALAELGRGAGFARRAGGVGGLRRGRSVCVAAEGGDPVVHEVLAFLQPVSGGGEHGLGLGLDVEFLAEFVADPGEVAAALVETAAQIGLRRGGAEVGLLGGLFGFLLGLRLGCGLFLGGLGGLSLRGLGVQDGGVERGAFLRDAEIVLEASDRLLRHQRHGLLEPAVADQAHDQGNHQERDTDQGDGEERGGDAELDALALQFGLGEGNLVIELPGCELEDQFQGLGQRGKAQPSVRPAGVPSAHLCRLTGSIYDCAGLPGLRGLTHPQVSKLSFRVPAASRTGAAAVVACLPAVLRRGCGRVDRAGLGLSPVHTRSNPGDSLSRRRKLLYILMLGALTALGPFTVDLYLLAFPALEASLGVSEAAVQLTLTGTTVGFALGQLVVGPLSDKFGRRLPLILATAVHIGASLGAALSTDIGTLGLFRVLMGIGAAGGGVVAMAMVRDLFSGYAMVRMFSRMALVNGMAPILAPLIGSQLLLLMPWPGIFWFLGGYGSCAAPPD